MSRFQISASLPIEELCIDSARYPAGVQRNGVVLQLAGWENGGTPVEIGTMNTDLIRISIVSEDRSARVTNFRIQPVQSAKGRAGIFARPQGGGPTAAYMAMTIGGVTNQTGRGGAYWYDLIATLLGRSEDPVKLFVYQRILSIKNNTLPDSSQWQKLLADQPLKQNTDMDHPSNWNCGTAASMFGNSFFGKSHFGEATTRLYNPPKSDRMADLTFNADVVRSSLNRLNQLLAKGIAVRVFAAHDDGFKIVNGVIQATGKTHFLTIVGGGPGDEYLTTDPWPGGSRSMYTSGILGNVDCAFMGRLKFTGDQLATHQDDRGVHNYKVLTGP
jgi:hypothetical protein